MFFIDATVVRPVFDNGGQIQIVSIEKKKKIALILSYIKRTQVSIDFKLEKRTVRVKKLKLTCTQNLTI